MSVAAKGPNRVCQVNQNKGLYPKGYIKKAVKDAPEGVKIVLSGNAPNGNPLATLGYHYCREIALYYGFGN
jgi:hypothetical protein